ncbi:hypothetical protein PFISCL1PPCAC_6291, partial [Pristionchus fissidentatus]
SILSFLSLSFPFSSCVRMGASTPPPKKRIFFSYPALPEIKLCWIVTICTVAYGWSKVYQISQKYKWDIGDQASVQELPLIGKRFKDEANWEWSRWSPYAFAYLPIYFGHVLLFNIGSKILPDNVFSLVYTLASMAAVCYAYTPILVLYSFLQGTLIFITSRIIRNKFAVWISSLPILYFVMHETHKVHADVFLVLLFVSYSILSYISFCLETTDGAVRPEDDTQFKQYLRMFFYTFYQPYLVSLIILYPDFERQIKERSTQQRDWKSIIIFALRIAFWWGVTELVLHFFYFETLLLHTEQVARVDKTTFVALGMTLGQFFHLKYVVIFGLPSLFARFDNMQPMAGPMCLARVCLYSHVWRSFDRGLYQFFKKYIFIPICQPDFTLWKKIFGVFISYGFVLLWHGFYHHNIVWILLNIAALFMEMTTKALYGQPAVRDFINARFSALTIRRILGWLQIIPFAFGLYSNFYFLAGSKVGGMYVDRVLVEETLPCRPFFLYLITIGYFYTQTCMEVDRWNEQKTLEEEKMTKKKSQKSQ